MGDLAVFATAGMGALRAAKTTITIYKCTIMKIRIIYKV